MSAINQAHINFRFPAPAMGQNDNLARKGFSEVEGEHTLKTAVRSPLSARVTYKILQLGLRTNLMRRAHITRQTDGMGLNELTKTVTRHFAAPIWREQSWQHDPASVFNKLFERWENSQNHAPDDFYWSTFNENYTDAQWIPSSLVTVCLRSCQSSIFNPHGQGTASDQAALPQPTPLAKMRSL